MTGPQLRTWRIAEGLSMREVTEQLLGKQISQPTLSRWEDSPNEIPAWAAAAILSKTKIELPIDELQALLDYARQHKLNFRQLIARAISNLLATDPVSVPTNFHLNEEPPKYGSTQKPDRRE